MDLRERVVAAFHVGDMSDEEVAALFKVGEATVHRWKRLKRETGSVVPRAPRGGGMPPLRLNRRRPRHPGPDAAPHRIPPRRFRAVRHRRSGDGVCCPILRVRCTGAPRLSGVPLAMTRVWTRS